MLADRTQTIRASVQDVEITLLITIALVVGVIFLFLRNVRATLIPSAVIPLALLATCGVMLALKFSLDNLSLMAATIAVGFVVDDAIVMVEVIWRHIEEVRKPFAGGHGRGSSEITFTIMSIAISLIAVFTPLMFMGGVVGRLMNEFAVTLSAAVAVSILLSLSLTPMLCALFLKPPKPPSTWFMKEPGAGLHPAGAWLCPGVGDRAGSHGPDPGGVHPDGRRRGRALRHGADRLLPATGHRLHPRGDDHVPGRLLR